MDHARRHETQHNKDRRPGSPTTTHMSRMSRAYNSSAESPFSRRHAHAFSNPTSNLGFRRCRPSKPRLKYNSKTQISHAEWRDMEKKKKEMEQSQEVTKGRVQKKHTHRVSSAPFEKPATSGSLTSRTFPSNEEDKRFAQDRNKAQSKTDKRIKVEQPSSVSQATARSRAVPQKRKETEEFAQGRNKAQSKTDKRIKVEQPSSVSQATARSRAVPQKRKETEEFAQDRNKSPNKTDKRIKVEQPSSVSQATAKSRAVQQKRKETEEQNDSSEPEAGPSGIASREETSGVQVRLDAEWSESFEPEEAGPSGLGSREEMSDVQVRVDAEFAQGRNKAQSKTDQRREVEQPSSVSQDTARSKAIQQKRKEIEEVYQRDCGTFGMVVRKLVSKDPSLVPPIRFSLRENLREIGVRCAAAMDQFITQYDLRDMSQ